ncbi:MAG: peptidoglycan-binding domain-containing protein [Bryobacteraceae bacterium]
MALQSKLFTQEGPGRPVLQRCAETHAGHLLRGMATNPAIKDAIQRVQTALRSLGFTISDPSGVYGASTEAAVLKFKGPPRNILGPGQTRPDAIVGVQTIHRLDEAISGKAPAPVVLEFGSNNWRFSFFGNKGVTGKGIYSLFIASTEISDSQSFSISELFATGSLIGGFKGQSGGLFSTPKKVKASEFIGAGATISIQKNGKLLHGTIQLNVSIRQFQANLALPPFFEEGLLGGATSGNLVVRGNALKS